MAVSYEPSQHRRRDRLVEPIEWHCEGHPSLCGRDTQRTIYTVFDKCAGEGHAGAFEGKTVLNRHVQRNQ